jgi:hypothetical protein
MNDSSVFSGLLDTLKVHWKVILVMALLAGIAATIFTLPALMPPRYKSTAVIYPVNIEPMSDESETEQMLQLLADNDIKDEVINRFKLYERAELVPGSPEYNYWMDLFYQERVSIGPTRYESVEITCQDEDPVVAKEMVVTILEVYNQELNESIRSKHEEYRRLVQGEMMQLKYLIDSLTTRISDLRTNSGVLDFGSQSERYAEGYMRLIERGGSKGSLEKVEGLMADMADKGSEVEILQSILTGFQDDYATLTTKVAVERSKVKNNLSYYMSVVDPQVADKKSYPVRWVVLLVSVILAVLTTVIFLIAMDRWKSMKA